MTARLSLDTLLRAWGRTPAYDPAALAIGHVHLGLGAFHKAHQALYSDDAIAAENDMRWGIAGLSLRSPGARDALAPQDGLYTVIERGEDVSARVVGAVRRALHVPSEREAALGLLADPGVAVVTLTVTEKGYGHDPGTGALNAGRPDIAADLASPREPATAVGLLCEALRRRREAGVGPLALISCDNVADNGRTLERVVGEFARAAHGDLADPIADHATFPATMIDRIVPAATDATRGDAERLVGLTDAAAVEGEPFRQWVIEDRFPGPRPAWEAGGAEFVGAIGPFQQLKLRLLNGPHSGIAYTGQMLGLPTVADAMADRDVATFVERIMRAEIEPTLELSGRYDTSSYIGALLARFRNPAIRHRTDQIAMDGTLKLPVRWLPTLRDGAAAGMPMRGLSHLLALWLVHWRGTAEDGSTIVHDDPGADAMRRLRERHANDPEAQARAYLAGTGESGDVDALAPRVADAMRAIERDGVRDAMCAAMR